MAQLTKYEPVVLKTLRKDVHRSTREVQALAEKRAKKKIHWYSIYHILMNLQQRGKIESFKAKGGIYWKLR